MGRVVLYEIDEDNGNVLSMTQESDDYGDVVTTYEYYDNGLLKKVTEPLDPANPVLRETLYDYNPRGLVERVTFADGTFQTYGYDLAGNLTSVTDERGHETIYEYDALNRLVSVKLPATDELAVSETSFDYDLAGNPTLVTDALGRETVYEYDDRGRLERVIEDFDGSTVETRYTYDEEDNLRTVTDRNDHTTTYTYDARNRLETIADAEGGVTSYDYYDNNLVERVTDRLGYATEYDYDHCRGWLTEVTDAYGNTTTFTYDDAGNRTSVMDRNGRETAFTYDDLDRLRTVTEGQAPDLYTTTYDYDVTGDSISVLDRRGNLTTLTYDARHRLEQVTDAEGYDTIYTYDNAGNPASVRDRNNHTTTYVYDARNQLVSITDPSSIVDGSPGYTSTRSYDPVGNLASATDRNGNVTEYTYDALDQLASVTAGAGTPVAYQMLYDYDPEGNLLSMTEPGVGGDRTTTYTYDDINRLIEIRDPLSRLTQIAHDLEPLNANEGEHVVQMTDPLGAIARTGYDRLYREVSRTEILDSATTYLTTYQYDNETNMTQVTDPRGHSTTYVYDALDRLETATDPDTLATTYGYDPEGNVISVSDRLNRTTTYSYDALNRLETVTDPASHSTTYGYDPEGNLTSASDRNHITTTYEYDELNRQVERADAEGGVFAIAYDPAGNVYQETDEENRTTTYAYDALNRLDTVTDHVGETVVYGYDAASNLASIKDELGRETRFEYDKLDRQTKVTPPMGDTYATNIAYSDDTGSNRLVVTTTDARSLTTTDYYDARDRLLQTTDHNGGDRVYTYDGNDNLLSFTDELSRTTEYVYDELNRQVGIIEPLAGAGDQYNSHGHTFTTVYDAVGNAIEAIDALDRATTYDYDPQLDWLLKVTDPEGGETIYTYDNEGILETVTDPVGNTTTFGYDDLYRLTSETNQLGLTRTYDYDKVRNLVRESDRNGRVRTFEYDHRDLLVKEHWLDGDTTLRTFTYDYDAAAQLESAYDPDSRYTYDYNDNGWLTEVDNAGTPGFGQVILDYDYDPAGNLTQVTDTLGGIQTYTYDNLNRVASIEQTGMNVAEKRVELSYDPASQLETVQRFNDLAIASEEGEDGAIAPPFLTSSYSFDTKGRLTSLTHGSIASYSFTYDPVSRITAWTNPQGSGSFSYDDTDQLTSAEYDYQNDESYDYDLNGNRTNDGYNTIANNRLETDGIYNYEYDNEGNRIRRTAIATGEITEYTWDDRDRLTSVETSSREGEVLSVVEYTYDVFDNRLSKQADTNGDGELDIFEGYIYNGDHIYIVLEPDQFTYELDSAPSNGMVAIAPDGSFTYTPNEDFFGEDSFTYTETGLDGDTETLTYTVDASTGEIIAGSLVPEEPLLELPVQRYFYGPGVDWVLAEEAIAYSEDGITTEVEWALTDHLNSVTFVLDSTGAVLNAIAYDSFGNVTSQSDPGVDFRFLYTGREFDPETGLYQYRARYYDSTTGRFLSEDPIGFDAGDVNLYRYVGNNPLVYVDPTGLFLQDLDWGVVAENAATSFVIGLAIGAVVIGAALAAPAIGIASIAVIGAALVAGSGYAYYNRREEAVAGGNDDLFNGKAALAAAGDLAFGISGFANLRSILESKLLYPSRGFESGRHGNGQYLADISPDRITGRHKNDLTKQQLKDGKLSLAQLSSLFYNKGNMVHKLSHFIEIDVTGLVVRQGVTTKGNEARKGVQFILSDDDLDLANRIVNYGKVLE